ncbi:g4686 [Coccomyxa viridis]|uniref:G4686 protein n=1 Tax=Coccomyxa viridis TaxID=1274662 RepID=A0ABP1FW51_9CHLO
MSEGKSAPETNRLASSPCFVCAEEAAALLNCAAEKKYNEMRCYPLIKKLRACVEKKGVVDFKLVPEPDCSQ